MAESSQGSGQRSEEAVGRAPVPGVQWEFETRDYIADAVSVAPSGASCSHSKCLRKGAAVSIEVHFVPMPVEYRGHLLRYGLAGGVLKLDLVDHEGADFSHVPTIEDQTVHEITEGVDIRVGFEPKNGAFDVQASGVKEKGSIPFANISFVGTPSRPGWNFRSWNGRILEGKAVVRCRIVPKGERPCLYSYRLSTVKDHWHCEPEVSNEFIALFRFFIRVGCQWRGYQEIKEKWAKADILCWGNGQCEVGGPQ